VLVLVRVDLMLDGLGIVSGLVVDGLGHVLLIGGLHVAHEKRIHVVIGLRIKHVSFTIVSLVLCLSQLVHELGLALLLQGHLVLDGVDDVVAGLAHELLQHLLLLWVLR